MSALSKRIVEFITSPFLFIYETSQKIEDSLLKSLYFSTVLLYSLFTLVFIFNIFDSRVLQQDFENLHLTVQSNNSIVTRHISNLAKRVTSLSNRVEYNTKVLRGLAQNSNTKFKPPITIFISLKMSHLSRRDTLKDAIHIGLSLSAWRDLTHIPLVRLSDKVPSYIVFDAAQAMQNLMPYRTSFSRQNIEISNKNHVLATYNPYQFAKEQLNKTFSSSSAAVDSSMTAQGNINAAAMNAEERSDSTLTLDGTIVTVPSPEPLNFRDAVSSIGNDNQIDSPRSFKPKKWLVNSSYLRFDLGDFLFIKIKS